MDEELRRAGAVGAIAFVLVFGALTVLRTAVHPPVGVQSQLVQGGAVLLFLAIAAYAYIGGEPVPAFLLALGPTAAFTVKLFRSGESTNLTAVTFYGVVVGIAVAGLVTLFGYITGRAADVLLGENKGSGA